jgi:hypothetical protein
MKRERGALSRASRALRLSPFVYLLLIQPGKRSEGLEKRTGGHLTEGRGEQSLIPSGLEEGRALSGRGKHLSEFRSQC